MISSGASQVELETRHNETYPITAIAVTTGTGTSALTPPGKSLVYHSLGPHDILLRSWPSPSDFPNPLRRRCRRGIATRRYMWRSKYDDTRFSLSIHLHLCASSVRTGLCMRLRSFGSIGVHVLSTLSCLEIREGNDSTCDVVLLRPATSLA